MLQIEPMPTDFYYLAGNLGIKYWLSIVEGGYSTSLRPSLEDIRENVAAHRRECTIESYMVTRPRISLSRRWNIASAPAAWLRANLS